MSQKEIIIKDSSGAKIGAIGFDENPPALPIVKSAVGVNLTMPATIELEWRDRQQPRPTLTNLRADLYLRGQSGSEIYLCHIYDEEYYEGATPHSLSPVNLVWTDALRGLILIEGERSGGQPQLEIALRGELCYIVACAETLAPSDHRIFQHPPRWEIRTAPYVRLLDRVSISYSVAVWETMIETAFDLCRNDPYILSLPLQSFLRRRDNE